MRPTIGVAAILLSACLVTSAEGQPADSPREIAIAQAMERAQRILKERPRSEPPQEVRPRASRPSLRLSGHYKNLFGTSRLLSAGEQFYGNLHRLRLEAKGSWGNAWKANVVMDNELLVSDFARSSDFDSIRQRNHRWLAFWDMDTTSVDDDHLYVRHGLYRATLAYDRPQVRVTVGKQRIAWGRSRLWYPLDLFNPISPWDFEQDERVGVDAAAVDWRFGDRGGLSVAYAPHRTFERTKAGVKASWGLGDYDLFLLGGIFQKDEVAGGGFDGSLGSGGLRGEFTVTRADTGRRFLRAVLGAEHHFNKVSIVGEYFYNGGAEDNDVNLFLFSYPFSNRVLSLQKHLLAGWIKYEPMPLLKLNLYGSYDFEGKSSFLNPHLQYDMTRNLELAAGIHRFWGDENSELGNFQTVYYAIAKWSF